MQDWEGSSACPAQSIEWLLDNGEAYERLLHALRAARRSVRIAQLALDADCLAYPRAPGTTQERSSSTCGEGEGEGEALAAALLAAAARDTVEVSVLLNATLLLDTTKPLRRFFDAAGGLGIRVRGTSRFPHLMHAKIVIVDGAEAFLLGSPFVNGYWDDERHRPVDMRRPARELGGRPLHDVSLRITGPVVDHLDAFFSRLWNEATNSTSKREATLRPPHIPVPPPERSTALRLLRTVPRGALSGMPDGATEILDACLVGIARARSLIYVEHQYLSARPVVAALAAALRRVPTLEVVVVLNQNPDVTAYRMWQNARLTEWGMFEHPRVGLFALWSAESLDGESGRVAINQVFVHSKVMVVDDTWAMLGSANLDGASLHSYGDDFEGWLPRRLFRNVRNFEVNVVIDDGIDGIPGSSPVADLRTRLWCEHLGTSKENVAERPARGWLALWRRRAAENVAALNACSTAGGWSCGLRGYVLPYSSCARPREQLTDMGIHASAALDLRFNPGWLEVHFSPNWVRNMFHD